MVIAVTADKRPLLAKIHIAKAQLNLDDDQYRDIVRRVTGKDSAAQCRYSQLVDLINEFKSLGWKTEKKKAFRRAPSDGIKKIYALWGKLQALGAVQSTDKTALDAFVKNTRASTVFNGYSQLNNKKLSKFSSNGLSVSGGSNEKKRNNVADVDVGNRRNDRF